MTVNMADVSSIFHRQVQSVGHDLGIYQADRRHLIAEEVASRWDEPARRAATSVERRAQLVVNHVRERERDDPRIYGNVAGEAVPGPTTRDMGGRFLTNKSHIEQSDLFHIATRMPKGAHLHLHFNAELPPEALLPLARAEPMQQTMFIRTTQALRCKADFDNCEIVFNVMPKHQVQADCFSSDYNPDAKNPASSPWMLWHRFREQFPPDVQPLERVDGLDAVECWAREKMVVLEDRVSSARETLNGAWACFNQGTRAFKGLVNYQSAYRWYVGRAIESMLRDGIMYAELRPMLMDKTIPSDDGLRLLNHHDQMQIICEEVDKKQAQLARDNRRDDFPFGLKIIYCAPRSIPESRMETELQDCIKLKLAFPDLICGFDLVGAEDRPNHIGFYAKCLLAFTETCRSLGISIPFLFHAGETLLDTGGSKDPENSNLYDALLLHSRRVGHGYALLKHPMLIERYKQQNVCLELCPISNELLKLCGNAREHPYPALLAAGLHCTLNADNPGLFRGATSHSASLSHEFHQVMVGDTRMTIHGWKQLAEWSIEHSCLGEDEKAHGLEVFRQKWLDFCEWIIERYEGVETKTNADA